MKPSICQSCGFPFSEKFSGTNRDDSESADYCRGCLEKGEFTEQHLTIVDMERRLLEMAKENNQLSIEEARQVIKILPDLKRWKMTHIL